MQTPKEKNHNQRREKENSSFSIINKSNNITPITLNNISFFNNSNPFKTENFNVFAFTPLAENSNKLNYLNE